MGKHNLALVAGAVSLSLVSQAAVFWSTGNTLPPPGTGDPLPTLGGYAMLPFGDDPRAEFSIVNDAQTPPVAGTLLFDRPMELYTVGSGWATWSGTYAGDVYFTDDQEVTMFLPLGNVLAADFKVEPDIFDVFDFFAVSDNGTMTDVVGVNGLAGAQYIGFWSDDVDDPLAFIYVKDKSGGASGGFAVGQFRVNVPEPAAFPAIFGGLALAGAVAYRRFKK